MRKIVGGEAANVETPEALRLLRDVYESLPEKLMDSTRAAPFPDGLNYIRFKLELSQTGSLELELSGKPKLLARERDSDLYDLPTPYTGGLPCTPTDATAKKIMKTCDDVFEAEKGDCNGFVKAAADPYFGDIFKGLDADGIINLLARTGSGWTKTMSMATCVEEAQAGKFVIAGMTSSDLDSSNGHLAVVIACPRAASGQTTVPIGYAGSIGSASARIRGARLSGTFPREKVWNEEVAYFWKAPTT